MRIGHLLLTIIISLFAMTTIAQSDKQLQSTIDLFDSDPDKAIGKLRKLINKEGDEARIEAWDLLVDMYERIYSFAASAENPQRQELQYYYNVLSFKKDSILQIDESLRSEDAAEIIELIDDELRTVEEQNMLLHAREYDAFLGVCREATLRSTSSKADLNLRNMVLPTNPDTFHVSDKDNQLYTDVVDLIGAGKYSSAEMLLSELHKRYPESYSVLFEYFSLYAEQSKTDSAKVYIEKLVNLYPEILAPREHMARIMFREGNYYGAKKQVFEMMKRYAGQDIKNYYREVLIIEHKIYNEHRINRNFEPNRIGTVHGLVPDEWKAYRQAKVEFGDNCNDIGIREAGEKSDYLELYSWRKLLDAHRAGKPEFLSYAYQMEEKGFLDCYVMVSMFHVDFFEQYQHWAKNNGSRIADYLELHCVEYAE